MSRPNCPAKLDDLAEAYCLGRLDETTAGRLEDHYLTCPICAERVAETLEFIRAFRATESA